MSENPSMPAPQQGERVVEHHYHEATKTNGLAIAGMVLGIVWLYWIGSILAIIFSGVALKQIGEAERKGQRMGGKGMAIAGLVLGLIGAATLLLVIIVAASADTSGY